MTEAASTDVEVLLVRHGLPASYESDSSLTEQGIAQARELGAVLSSSLANAREIRVYGAPAPRATETAKYVARALRDHLGERSGRVRGPETAPELVNFRVWTPAGFRDPTGSHTEYRSAAAAADREGRERPAWVVEIERFFAPPDRCHPIDFWLRTPLLYFEPPALVVRRFILGVRTVGAALPSGAVAVCVTHSGPMRALATWGIGRDLGEPDYAEIVGIGIDRRRDVATIRYRGEAATLQLPFTSGLPEFPRLDSQKPTMIPD